VYGGQHIVSRKNLHIRTKALYSTLAGCYESSYNDPRDFPELYGELVRKHKGVLTQHLPGYSEGLSMEMNWWVFATRFALFRLL
jgi:hypothetical protein